MTPVEELTEAIAKRDPSYMRMLPVVSAIRVGATWVAMHGPAGYSGYTVRIWSSEGHMLMSPEPYGLASLEVATARCMTLCAWLSESTSMPSENQGDHNAKPPNV